MAVGISAGALIGSQIAGSALSGLFNMGNSALSAHKSYKLNSALMDQQYRYTRQLNRNAYQDTTYSMRQAGINPMLAISNGVNGLSAGSGGNVSVNTPQMDLDLAGAYSTAKQLKNDTDRVKNETKLADSTSNKNDYEADLAHEQSVQANNINRAWDDYGRDLDFATKQQEFENAVKTGANIEANTAKAVSDMKQNVKMTKSNIKANTARAVADEAESHSHPYKDFSDNVIQPIVNSAKKGDITFKNVQRYFNRNVHHFFTGSYGNY